MSQVWERESLGVYAEGPTLYLLLALGKIPESHWLSIVIQVRALNWQPEKLPKQWAGQVEIDPSGLLYQIVSKSSVPCSMLIQSSVWPQWGKTVIERKYGRKKRLKLAVLSLSLTGCLSNRKANISSKKLILLRNYQLVQLLTWYNMIFVLK